ncbi:MAG: hypothetical protein Q8N51_20620 [Gammaproteobacteria bacterium]|nr:hypothetical protein [Gammaproteobacteria bacterium]
MSDLATEAEKLVNGLVTEMLATREGVEKAIPRAFGSKDMTMEQRLEKFHRSLDPVTLSGLRKVYGGGMLAREVLELWPEYARRIGNAAQMGIATSPASPEQAVG